MSTTATKSRPILFSGPMVRAILDGRKTQTRRLVNRVSGHGQVRQFQRSTTPGYDWQFRCRRGLWQDYRDSQFLTLCPYGQPGDELWVRETWAPYSADAVNEEGEVIYRASYDATRTGDASTQGATKQLKIPVSTCVEWSREIERYEVMGEKWRPSIHMPRWASRITLTVKAVRVERLQDISHDDAIAEGILGTKWAEAELTLREQALPLSVLAYSHLWEEINGPDSWAANPWVWVVEFERKAVG